MPTYSYKCNDCNAKFELYHKSMDTSDASCPVCSSASLKKLVTAPNIGSMEKVAEVQSSCGSGGCACGLN